MNFIRRTSLAIREIQNYFYIKNVIKKERKSIIWKEFKLRVGYINQIYTIINLKKEDMGEEQMVQRMRVVEKMEPIGKYLDSLGMGELLHPEIVYLPDTQSWLIVFWPMRKYFSFWKLFGWIGLISLIVYIINFIII